MNKKELSDMALAMTDFGIPINNPIWQKAFKVYNDFNAANSLSMSCRPCYGKVLSWHILNLE